MPPPHRSWSRVQTEDMCAAETDELVRHVLRAAAVCPWRCLGLTPGAVLEQVRKRYIPRAREAAPFSPDKMAHEKSKDAFAAVEHAFQDCMARITGRASR